MARRSCRNGKGSLRKEISQETLDVKEELLDNDSSNSLNFPSDADITTAIDILQSPEPRRKISGLKTNDLCDSKPKTKAKRYKCSYCGDKVSFKRHLDIHEQVHSGQMERPFDCDKTFGCNYIAVTLTQLLDHLCRTDLPKCFICDYPGCRQSFDLRGKLTVHRLKHERRENARVISCSRCSFATRNNKKELKRHVKMVHDWNQN